MKPKSRNLLFSSPLAIAISIALGGSAWGAVKTWTGTTDGTLLTGTNWGGAAPVTGDSFVFTSATGAGGLLLNNNLTSAAFSVAGITFSAGSGAYVIGDGTANANVGNTFVLTGNVLNSSTNLQTINTPFSMTAVRTFTTTGGGGDLLLGGNISGTGGGVTKAGAGTLTLSGTNTQTGNTTVSAGTLIISGSHSGNGTITVSSGASMAISGTYSGNGAITLNGGTLDLGNGSATGTLASTVLTLNGGAFNYTRTGGANTHTFTTTNINAGSPTVSAVAGNTLNLGNVVRANGGTMDFSSVGAGIVATTTANVGGIMSGFTFGDTWAVGNGAGVAISGLGTYTLSSVAGTTAGNYTGNNIDVDDSAGTLSAGITANSLRFSAAGANTMTLTGANTITTGGILVGSGVGSNLSTITGGTLTGVANRDLLIVQNNTSGGLTISSDIINTTSTSVTKSGAGLLTLSGNNTFTGGVLINAGKLAVGSAGALNSTVGSENAVTFGAGSTGTFGLGGTSVVIRSLATNANNLGTPVVENASGSNATLTVGNSLNLGSTFAGTIQDGTGAGTLALAKAGTNTLTLTGTNTYSGGTTINAGILTVTTDANLGNASTKVTLNGGRLNVASANLTTSRVIEIGASGGAISVSGNNSLTSSGKLSGSGVFTMFDPGGGGNKNINFNATNNDFTGGIIITQGGSGAGNTVLTVNSLLDSSNNIAFNGAATASAASFIYGTGAITGLSLTNRAFELNSGAGTLNATIQNNNTTHAITIGSNLVATGGTAKTLTLNAVAGPSNVYSGSITDGSGGGTVGVTASGAGKWTLSNATNTFTGAIRIASQTLAMNSLSTTGETIFLGAAGTTGTFEYLGSGQSTGRQVQVGAQGQASGNANILNNGTGALIFSAGTFNISDPSTGGSSGTRNVTLGGSYTGGINEIQGDIIANAAATLRDIAIIKTGAGSWKLSGNSSYTKATSVEQGNLIAGNNALVSTNGAFGNAASEINLGLAGGNNAAGLLIDGAFNVGRDIRLLTSNTTDTGTRVLTIGGNSAANSEFSGNIFLGTTNQAGRGVTLTAAGGGQVTFSGVIQNPTGMDATSYTVTKSGLGKVILSNTNTYTGATNVDAGKLEIAAGGSTAAGSAFTVTNTGTELIVNGTLGGSLLANSGTFVSGSGTIGGAATINGTYGPGNSPGTMTHLNTLTLAGTIIMEIDGNNGAGVTGGHDFVNLTGVGAAGLLTYGGAMTLDIGTIFGNGAYSWNLYDFASETSTFSTISLADQYSGSLLDGDLDGIWDLTSGGDTWQFTESDGVLSLNVIPEPSVVLLGGLGALLMFRRRRA